MKYKQQKIFLLLTKKIYGRLLCLENIAIFYLPVTHNEPISAVSISPNGTQITKLVLNNNTSNVPVKCGKVEEFQNKSESRKIFFFFKKPL